MSDPDSRDVVLFALSRARLINFVDGKSTIECHDGGDHPSTAAVVLDECVGGGVANVDAFVRGYSSVEEGANYVVLPDLDRRSVFTELHPDGLAAARKILKDVLGWKFYTAHPSFLTTANQEDVRTLKDHSFPFLLSDVSVPPSNSFSPYVRNIYFDESTGLAIMCAISLRGDSFHLPLVDTLRGLTQYIAKVNRENGCYSNNGNDDGSVNGGDGNPPGCWIPVVVVFSTDRTGFAEYFQAITSSDNPDDIPALMVDGMGTMKNLYSTPTRVLNNNTWVVSGRFVDTTMYQHLKLTRSNNGEDRLSLSGVELVERSLESLPEAWKDETYRQHVQVIGDMVDEAIANDSVIGYTGAVPEVGTACRNGECPTGNLVTDAFRWKAEAHVGFMRSDKLGLHAGWEAGPVTTLDVWKAYPSADNLCQGVMSGVSLFKLMEYSTRVAEFQGDKGSRLLQVSGMRVIYNANLPNGESRLMDLDIWNETLGEYEPVQRLSLYRFAAPSRDCTMKDPFPALTGGDFVMDGEIPGSSGDESVLSVVVEFLATNHNGGTAPYDTSLQGRLVNDTLFTAEDTLNLVETPDSCNATSFFEDSIQSCSLCPTTNNVVWVGSSAKFYGETKSARVETKTAALVNGVTFPVNVGPRSLPSFLNITQATLDGEELGNVFAVQDTLLLPSLARLTITYEVSAKDLEPGTVKERVAFGIFDGGTFVGCEGADASFDVVMYVDPQPEMNYLGNARYAGWALAGIVLLSVTFLVTWVKRNDYIPVVRKMQPHFLYALCVGIGIISCSLITLSFDDQIVPTDVCSGMCMATAWLSSLGFTMSSAALFSKLLRINKLLNAGSYVRRTVKVKHVILPGSIMLCVNIVVLLLWTTIDPLTWQRRSLEGERWNTYGTCRSSGTAGKVFFGLTIAVNAVAFLAAVWQAFKARHLPSEFSVSKYVGIAVFSWLELLLVGVPVLFLIDDDNTLARYILRVAVVFVVCASMLCLIFVPIIWSVRKYLVEGDSDDAVSRSSLSRSPFASHHRIYISGLRESAADERSCTDFAADIDKEKPSRQDAEGTSSSHYVPRASFPISSSSVSSHSDTPNPFPEAASEVTAGESKRSGDEMKTDSPPTCAASSPPTIAVNNVDIESSSAANSERIMSEVHLESNDADHSDAVLSETDLESNSAND